jgi:hypothetical protein
MPKAGDAAKTMQHSVAAESILSVKIPVTPVKTGATGILTIRPVERLREGSGIRTPVVP